MPIILYTPSWSSYGGGEKYLCVLAETLARKNRGDVRLVLDRTDVSREKLRRYFNLSLEGVEIVTLRRHDVQRALRGASTVFLMSNVRSFGIPAPATMYILQIPYASVRPFGRAVRGNFRDAVKDLRRLRLLRDARRARGVIVYSAFVRDTLRRCHGIDSTILHPPIDDFASNLPKELIILSVGRFFRGLYNDKRYDILLKAFSSLHARLEGEGWEYHVAGSCGQDRDAQEYLTELRSAARGLPVHFHVNAPYEELRQLYGRASVFWHAAGFGVDETSTPERAEHFGMSTVESMSASCVPVVINRGGQKEIVTHGVNGFLWESVDDLVDLTTRLARDAALRQQMLQRARLRYADFGVGPFDRTTEAILTHYGL